MNCVKYRTNADKAQEKAHPINRQLEQNFCHACSNLELRMTDLLGIYKYHHTADRDSKLLAHRERMEREREEERGEKGREEEIERGERERVREKKRERERPPDLSS